MAVAVALADQQQYMDYIENAQHLITSYIRKAKQTDTDTASVPSTSGLTASMLQTSTHTTLYTSQCSIK